MGNGYGQTPAARREYSTCKQNNCILIIPYSLAASPNGWTDTEVMFEWVKSTFEPETAKIAEGRRRLLIFDGHISHCSLKLILFAESKGITILLLPPHTTHRLQPLDVGVFGPLSQAWKRVVKDMANKGYIVRKNNLISMYSQARKQALTEANIRTAFKRCGIEPYDPSVVTEQDLAPAERNSITSSLPLPPRLPPSLEIVEVIPGSTPGPIDSPDEGHFDPAASQTQPHPILISLADISNLHTKQSLKGLHVRRRARLGPPTKNASKRELYELVEALNDQVDQDTEELAAAFARETLANFENGRIREKLYAKKGGRAKTTHLKTGA
jgi:DDE superfamily endonuclease